MEEEKLIKKKNKQLRSATENTVGNFSTSLLLFPMGIIMSILLARILGPANLGIYQYITIFAETLFPLILLGSGTGVFFYISAEKYQPKEVIFSSLLIGAFNGVLFAVVLFLLCKFQLLGKTGSNISTWLLMPILITMPLTGVFQMSKQVFQGTAYFKTYNMIQISKFLFRFVLLMLFVVVADWSLEGAIWAMAIEDVAIGVVVIYQLYKLFKPRLAIQKQFLKESYTFGAKSWLSTLGSRSNDQLDQLILGFVASPAVLGQYKIAYSILKMMSYAPNAIAPVLFKLVAKANDKEKSARLTTQVHRALFLIVGAIALTLGSLSFWLVPFLYGKEYEAAVTPLIILLPGAICFWVTRRTINKYLTANNMPWETSLVQLIGALVGVVMYLLLIPSWGIIGAAVGSTIAYMTSTFCAIWYFYRSAGKEVFNLFTIGWKDIVWIKQKISSLFPFLKKYI